MLEGWAEVKEFSKGGEGLTWEGHCTAEGLKYETGIVPEVAPCLEAWCGWWECSQRGQILKSLLCLAEHSDFILKVIGVF